MVNGFTVWQSRWNVRDEYGAILSANENEQKVAWQLQKLLIGTYGPGYMAGRAEAAGRIDLFVKYWDGDELLIATESNATKAVEISWTEGRISEVRSD